MPSSQPSSQSSFISSTTTSCLEQRWHGCPSLNPLEENTACFHPNLDPSIRAEEPSVLLSIRSFRSKLTRQNDMLPLQKPPLQIYKKAELSTHFRVLPALSAAQLTFSHWVNLDPTWPHSPPPKLSSHSAPNALRSRPPLTARHWPSGVGTDHSQLLTSSPPFSPTEPLCGL